MGPHPRPQSRVTTRARRKRPPFILESNPTMQVKLDIQYLQSFTKMPQRSCQPDVQIASQHGRLPQPGASDGSHHPAARAQTTTTNLPHRRRLQYECVNETNLTGSVGRQQDFLVRDHQSPVLYLGASSSPAEPSNHTHEGNVNTSH